MEFFYRPDWFHALESFFEDMENFILECDYLYKRIKIESDDLFDTVDYDFHYGIKILYGEAVNDLFLNKLANLKRLDEYIKEYSYEDIQSHGKRVLNEQAEELEKLEADWNQTIERWKADFERWKAEESDK